MTLNDLIYNKTGMYLSQFAIRTGRNKHSLKAYGLPGTSKAKRNPSEDYIKSLANDLNCLYTTVEELTMRK